MQTNHRYKYLTFLTMLYMTVKLTTVVLIYKVITIGPFSASASTLVMPLWFTLGDLIAEVYGYKTARHLIWTAIICQFIFAIFCTALISINSPTDWTDQDAYIQVLGKLPRITFASFLAIISGAFINAYAISKWKVILLGKYFWLRSLGASAVGELAFTIIAYLIEFSGITPFSNLVKLMAISYVIKLAINFILIIPSSFIAFILKQKEKSDIFDYSTNYNPFKISLDEQNLKSLNTKILNTN